MKYFEIYIYGKLNKNDIEIIENIQNKDDLFLISNEIDLPVLILKNKIFIISTNEKNNTADMQKNAKLITTIRQ